MARCLSGDLELSSLCSEFGHVNLSQAPMFCGRSQWAPSVLRSVPPSMLTACYTMQADSAWHDAGGSLSPVVLRLSCP